MESLFKIVFFISILIFCIVIIGIFLLIIKILFLFSTEINIMGIKMIPQ
jgi:NADH:ubiquinone oxidoreductase subunit K